MFTFDGNISQALKYRVQTTERQHDSLLCQVRRLVGRCACVGSCLFKWCMVYIYLRDGEQLGFFTRAAGGGLLRLQLASIRYGSEAACLWWTAIRVDKG